MDKWNKMDRWNTYHIHIKQYISHVNRCIMYASLCGFEGQQSHSDWFRWLDSGIADLTGQFDTLDSFYCKGT